MLKRPLFLFLFVVFFQCSSSTPEGCPKKDCKDYASQLEAQIAFDGGETCLRNLDNDSDGKACEDEFATGNPDTNPDDGTVTPGTSNCPTTSSCGCSGKNKSECGGVCCKWTVGSGCGCK